MKNEVCVKISGLNLSRLINKLVAKNVLINDLVTKGKYIKFSISQDDLKILNEICKQEHKFYTIIYKNGLRQSLSKLPYLLGSILAIILVFVYMYSYSLFVFEVNVSYSSSATYDLTAVQNLLSENGIQAGMLKGKYKTKDIENLILLGIDNISGCMVYYQGGKLNICVYPATEKYEVSAEDLVSKYDAVIVKAEAFVGELCVSEGDIVKAGDVLIKNSDGTGAMGEIIGKVYLVGTVIYNENQQILEKTGNTFVSKKYSILNKFSINSHKNCTFSTFLTEKCSFYISQNYILPVLCEEIVYYEVQIKNVVIPFEDAQSKVMEEAYNQALAQIENSNQITNVTYSIVSDGSMTRVDCYIETEKSLI